MRRVLWLTVAAALAATLAASPSPAAADPVQTGERINLLFPPAAYEAGAPFHISHGYCFIEPQDVRLANRDDTRFELRIDGQLIDSVVDLRRGGRADEGCRAVKSNISEFPAGLPAGSYGFEGRWYLAGELDFSTSATIVFHDPITGPRLDLLDPPATFPAGAPFHVRHGYCFLEETQPEDAYHPDTRFDLYVNGVLVDSVLDLRDGDDADPGCVVVKFNTSTFNDGLPAGDHMFEGRWLLVGDLYFDVVVTISFE
jgi:hypothetical protein